MRYLLSIILLVAASGAVTGEEQKVEYRLTGLFQPDRVDDLRRQADPLVIHEGNARFEVKLAQVNYETAVVAFAYDADSPPFKNRNPDQVLERINNQLRHISRGSFTVSPLSTLKPEQQKEERIDVAGLDCKGCAYGAYRSIAQIDGVERAVVSFKDGYVKAWIDSSKTNRDSLIKVLKNAQVDVIEPKDK
jgi:copper chaperone CopZ